ncbi:hypothetical protein CPU12_03460 [Malaciobacter molluscorum LMG 25693]|uniref:Cytochrome c oxidase-associated protein CcoH n=1 Tax=Malaciobacter molluscorum LMG 25693 TaxID=870501 RepID=A0A2G1DKC7_9BACT|nr:hypothetical protein [Malaciobacter molluscorum]AXX91317.1 putative cytochrome c oxidase-associated protein CcoH [Malaciobacter molluscorum LMG 25693]PHO18929.1 hypothetical protein CPU12_03460 [Malaciobacter molluscorum LMG 25693]
MKRNYWPLFFICIFSFTLLMIVWTIHNTLKVPVNEDDAFLRKYQDIDENFNDVVTSNHIFLKKYNFKIFLNNEEKNLDINDVFLSQRAIEERTLNKDLLKVGENKIRIEIFDKKTNKLEDDFDIKFRITQTTNNNSKIDSNKNNFIFTQTGYIADIKVPKIGYWNIIATFEKDGNKGYLFIKTNAK